MSYWTHGDLSTSAWVALWFLKIISFAIAAFIFSVIFWATKNWLDKDHGNCCHSHDKAGKAVPKAKKTKKKK